ncbi:hypothetical protein ACRRTK_018096 [Alexandromys fortis]
MQINEHYLKINIGKTLESHCCLDKRLDLKLEYWIQGRRQERQSYQTCPEGERLSRQAGEVMAMVGSS